MLRCKRDWKIDWHMGSVLVTVACCPGYLGNVLLHGLEVEEGDVDQVVAMDHGHQLNIHSPVTFSTA